MIPMINLTNLECKSRRKLFFFSCNFSPNLWEQELHLQAIMKAIQKILSTTEDYIQYALDQVKPM